MNHMRMLVPMAVLALAACGGRDDGHAETTDGAPTADTTVTTGSEAPPAPAGTVDTAGVGTNPPTAGGQLVDTAAVPGPVDTTQGTTTAP